MLKPSQNAALDRADRELAELRRRAGAAAARESALDQRSSGVVVVVETVRRAINNRPVPVPDFVLDVFKNVAGWERAPVFVHAQFVRDIRALANSADDTRAVQLFAVDALVNAIAHVAGMHSVWASLHTSARRLVVRLEGGFGDGEDDIDSLQRLQRKLFHTSAMLVTAYVIEQSGLRLNLPAEMARPVSDAKPVSPAQRHREALRAAIARGDVVWSGDEP